ncbi:MAG: hypothetical protein M3Z09_03350 [Acidobacteriota bacterium]|nr:hypothetical protein [Acidobacteriota bacterium]
MRVGAIDHIRYFLLASDPGLSQLKHAAKTVLALVIALEVCRWMEPRGTLYAGLSAGFLMQSTAGSARRTRQISMASMGAASTLAVAIGSLLASSAWAKEALLVAAAFAAFYVRRFIPGKAMFPVFAFVLMLLATLQPGGTGRAATMMTAVAVGFASAYIVFFYVLPDGTTRAFRHAADLFLFRATRIRADPSRAADLHAMHRAVAFEEEEMETLTPMAGVPCRAVLAQQYEALQVLTILAELGREYDEDASQRAAREFGLVHLDEVLALLRQERALLNG